MENSQPPPFIDLSAQTYRSLVHTLTTLLPPPTTDTLQARQLRDQAAIAKVADLLPVNANEADLAVQCIAARAQAEDTLRLLRLHADDLKRTMQLNAQYATMVRTSLAAHGHLLRAQQLRHKREQQTANIDTDEWTRHIATRLMLDSLESAPAPIEPLPSEPNPETESHDTGTETPVRLHRPRWEPVLHETLPPVAIFADRPGRGRQTATLNS